MAGLGAAVPPSTDALGQLLSEYAKRVHNSQLQHLKVCLKHWLELSWFYPWYNWSQQYHFDILELNV